MILEELDNHKLIDAMKTNCRSVLINLFILIQMLHFYVL